MKKFELVEVITSYRVFEVEALSETDAREKWNKGKYDLIASESEWEYCDDSYLDDINEIEDYE